jgi:hypothetical protein
MQEPAELGMAVRERLQRLEAVYHEAVPAAARYQNLDNHQRRGVVRE